MNAPVSTQQIAAQWFDGRSARKAEVKLVISERSVAVLDSQGQTLAHVPKDLVKLSERIASTPYRLEFPDGALAVTHELAAIERSFRLDPSTHGLARMERAAWFVVLATLGLFIALYFAYRHAIPLLASAVAERMPREVEVSLGEATLPALDGWFFKPSELDHATQLAIRAEFDRLARAAGLSEVVRLEFRAMSPNALALPGGTIVITDGLVRLYQKDTRLLGAVIAHELGHIHHRHSLKHLLAGSASALIVGAVLGDVSGVSSLMTSAPIILSSLAYSRESEAEADRYAHELLRRSGRSPMDFADALRGLQRMETCLRSKVKDDDRCIDQPEPQSSGADATVATQQTRRTSYLDSHPVTEERIRAAEEAARQQ